MAKQKFYVVWEGHKPGVYVSWEECKRQVDSVAGAKYKSFESRTEAEAAFKSNYWKFIKKADSTPKTAASRSKSSIRCSNTSTWAFCSNPILCIWMIRGS